MKIKGYGISLKSGPYKTLENDKQVNISVSEAKKLAKDNKEMLTYLKNWESKGKIK